MLIEKDEGTAARRRVPFRLFTSNGTAPDTGASDDTALISKNGGAQAASGGSVSAISANAGMYYTELDAADVDTLGTVTVWHDDGDFPQHVATIEVVNFNPNSTLSAVATIDVNTIQISGDAPAANNLEAAFDGTGYDSNQTVFVKNSIATIAGVTNVSTEIAALNDIDGTAVALTAASRSLVAEDSAASVWDAARSDHVAAGSFGQYVVTDGGSGLSSAASVVLAPQVHSLATIRGIENDSVITIAGVTNVSTEIAALNDIDGTAVALTAASRSLVAEDSADSVWNEARADHVAANSFGQYVVTEAGSGLSSAASVVLAPQVHSLATVRGLENWSNLSGAFSNLTVQIEDSVATIAGITNPIATSVDAADVGAIAAASADSVWDEARSAHVDAGSFGQYVVTDGGSGLSSAASVVLAPQVHSLATVRGIENDSVMTIAGTTNTATLIGALNDIDGSEVTLHAGTHSNVTIKGIENDSVMTIAGTTNTATLIGALNDIDGSEVTLHAGTHSLATVRGIENVANIPSGGSSAAQIANAVWAETRTSHVTLGSFGLANQMASSDSVTQAGTTSRVDLGSGETTTDDVHNGAFIVFQYPSGQWVGNIVSDYDGSNQSVTLKNTLPVAPGSNVTYVIFPGTSETDLSAETVGSVLTVVNAASDYSVVLKPQVHSLATVRGLENIDNIPSGGSTPAQIADAIWDEARSGHVAGGSFGQYVVTDAGSGLSSAASVVLTPQVHSGATVRGIENDSVITIAGDTNTATLIGALNDIDGSEVTLHAGTHSGVTIKGIENDSVMTIAGVVNTATLIGALNDIDGSEVTLHAGTHSGATIKGIENSSVITIAGVTNVSTEIAALNDIDGSSVTLVDGGLTSAKFGVAAIDAAALATDAVQEIADGTLDRNMTTGTDSGSSTVRTMRDALRTLRNRVASDDTQIYVYEEDDTTIAWTASINTVASTADHISGADPNS